MPDLQFNYLAAQLTYVHWWGFPKMDIASVATQTAQIHSYEALINILYRNGPYPTQGADILKLSYKMFHMCNVEWEEPAYPFLQMLPWHNP